MDETHRRNFFTTVIVALGGLISAGLGLPAAVYLMASGKRKKGGDWVEAADVSTLDMRAPEEVVFRRNRVDGWKVASEKATAWLVKLSDHEIVAFAPQCTHLGCAYSFNERKNEFLCPCHSSNFSLEGKVLSGPAPRALDRYAVKVEHGKVLIGGFDMPQRSA